MTHSRFERTVCIGNIKSQTQIKYLRFYIVHIWRIFQSDASRSHFFPVNTHIVLSKTDYMSVRVCVYECVTKCEQHCLRMVFVYVVVAGASPISVDSITLRSAMKK